MAVTAPLNQIPDRPGGARTARFSERIRKMVSNRVLWVPLSSAVVGITVGLLTMWWWGWFSG